MATKQTKAKPSKPGALVSELGIDSCDAKHVGNFVSGSSSAKPDKQLAGFGIATVDTLAADIASLEVELAMATARHAAYVKELAGLVEKDKAVALRYGRGEIDRMAEDFARGAIAVETASKHIERDACEKAAVVKRERIAGLKQQRAALIEHARLQAEEVVCRKNYDESRKLADTAIAAVQAANTRMTNPHPYCLDPACSSLVCVHPR